MLEAKFAEEEDNDNFSKILLLNVGEKTQKHNEKTLE